MNNYAGRTPGRAAGRGGAGCWPSYSGAGWAAGQVTPGRGGLRAMMWQHLMCGLTASQVTAGRAAGYDVTKCAVRADCGPSCCGAGGLRAQISSPRRALGRTGMGAQPKMK